MDFLKTVWGHVKDIFTWFSSWVKTYPRTATIVIVLLAASHLFF